MKRHVMTQVDVVFALSYPGTDGSFPCEEKVHKETTEDGMKNRRPIHKTKLIP